MIHSPQPFASNAKQTGTPSVYDNFIITDNRNPLLRWLRMCDVIALAWHRFDVQVRLLRKQPSRRTDDADTQLQFMNFCIEHQELVSAAIQCYEPDAFTCFEVGSSGVVKELRNEVMRQMKAWRWPDACREIINDQHQWLSHNLASPIYQESGDQLEPDADQQIVFLKQQYELACNRDDYSYSKIRECFIDMIAENGGTVSTHIIRHYHKASTLVDRLDGNLSNEFLLVMVQEMNPVGLDDDNADGKSIDAVPVDIDEKPSGADSSPDDDTSADVGRSDKPAKAGKGKHINARMLAKLDEKPESHNWSARQWADNLGCSMNTVGTTKVWKELLITARVLREVDKQSERDRRRG